MIYYAEDDENIRELMVYSLRRTGHEAEGRADAAALFRAMDRQWPELILLDIMMPGEDGLSALARLQADPSTRDIPRNHGHGARKRTGQSVRVGSGRGRLYCQALWHGPTACALTGKAAPSHASVACGRTARRRHLHGPAGAYRARAGQRNFPRCPRNTNFCSSGWKTAVRPSDGNSF